MSLLDIARGPVLQAALAEFVLGVSWRLLSLLLLPWAKDRSVARAGMSSAFLGASKGFVRHLWPPKAFARASLFSTINGYVFHIGLAIIVFGLVLGVVTAFVGLIVIIPVIGYATWHGYEETIDASAFPRHHEGVTATPRPASSAAMEHDPVI